MARVYDEGNYFAVSLNKREIDYFRDRWPAAGMSKLRTVKFEFDKRNGDLVDMSCNRGGGCDDDKYDGGALSALSRDAQEIGRRKLAKKGVSIHAERGDADLTWYKNSGGTLDGLRKFTKRKNRR